MPGENTSGPTTEPKTAINYEVASDRWERFKSTVQDVEGGWYGHAEKAVEDALELYIQYHEEGGGDPFSETQSNAILEQLEALQAEVSELKRERENGKFSDSSGNYNARTERKYSDITAELTSGTVSDDYLEHVIQETGGVTSRKTIKKYKKMLRNRGDAFPNPRNGAGPLNLDPGEWIVGANKFVARLELSEEFTPMDIDQITGKYDEFLEDGWYLEALDDKVIQQETLKYERIGESAAEEVKEYRVQRGWADSDDDGPSVGRTFQ